MTKEEQLRNLMKIHPRYTNMCSMLTDTYGTFPTREDPYGTYERSYQEILREAMERSKFMMSTITMV